MNTYESQVFARIIFDEAPGKSRAADDDDDDDDGGGGV
jgi:hypothetical protein